MASGGRRGVRRDSGIERATAGPILTQRARQVGRSSPRGLVHGPAGASPTILAGLLYLAVAVVTIGRGALAHPTSVCACSASPDPGFYMWLLRWLPFALLHGLNPLFTHEIWSPVGLNLAASAPIPVVALVLWPITTLAGPLAAFNVIAVLAPALAAGAMFRLCARVTGRLGASLAGGYLFGFGSYELGQSLGHPNLTIVFLVPLAVELVLRRLAAELTRRRFIIALAALVVVQALISTEILFDMALFGAVAFGWALVFEGRPQRAAILQTIAETIVAGLAAAVILIPFLVQALQSVTGGNANLYSLDLANVVIPTPLTWIGSGTFRALSAHFEGGAFSETGGYLGIPAFVAFAAFAVGARTRVGARVLLATAVVVLVAALGSHLHVAGHAGVLLPWSLVSHLPLFRALLPARFTLILELIVALGIAIWLAGGAATPAPRAAVGPRRARDRAAVAQHDGVVVEEPAGQPLLLRDADVPPLHPARRGRARPPVHVHRQQHVLAGGDGLLLQDARRLSPAEHPFRGTFRASVHRAPPPQRASERASRAARVSAPP